MFKIPTRLPLLRPKHRQRFLLEENFNSTAIDTSRWTVTDTQSKLSVSGGNLVCSGGKAVPAWGDPGLVGLRSFTRLAGLTIEWEETFAAANQSTWFGFNKASTNDTNSNEYMLNGNSARIGSSNVTLVISSAAISRFRIVCKTTGAYCYRSTDGGVTWPLIWITNLLSDANLWPCLMHNSAALTIGYARVYQGSVKPAVYSGTPAAPNPTLGDEIVINSTMEADSDWVTLDNPDQQVRSNEQAHGGTYSRKVPYDGISGSRGTGQSVAGNVGSWYQLSVWGYKSSGALPFVWWDNGSLGAFLLSGQWEQFSRTLRRTNASNSLWVYANSAEASTFYVDDVSVKPLTLSTLLSLAANPGTKNGLVDSAPTLTAGTQCGHAIWVDDETNPAYGVFAWHDGTNANLVKLVNGTWTSLIAAAATYSAGAQLRTVAVGTAVALYYNGTIVGTVQTIADAGFGTKVCGFSTLSTNTPGAISIETGIGV